MSKVEVVYQVQVRDGRGYATLERTMNVHKVPGDSEKDTVDFTPLSEPGQNMRLLFGVMHREFCHAAVGERETVRVHLASIHAGSRTRRDLEPDPALLETHGFRQVRVS